MLGPLGIVKLMSCDRLVEIEVWSIDLLRD